MSWNAHGPPATVGRLISPVAALTVAIALGLPPAARAACKLGEIAELHVEMVGNSPVIDGQINGQPIRVLLETGGTMSYVTFTAARKLALPIREYQSRTAFGVGGNESVRTAVVKELQIGPLPLKDYTANVAHNEIHDANGVASFELASDVLSHFATEFDFSRGVVRLLHPQDCKTKELAYWSPTFFQVDLQPGNIIDVKVNGKQHRARLVSGSATSYISRDAAKEAGVEPGRSGVEPTEPYVVSATASPIPVWIGRFDTIEVGAETIKNAHVRIGDVFPHGTKQSAGVYLPTHYKASYDVVLGSDFFQAHRIMIVPDQNVAIFTYNGGTVF